MFEEVVFSSADGLKLYARDYAGPDSAAIPVLCLSGLTRNSKEFHPLAQRLSKDRRVICPDYRGRGRSQYAADWQTYQVPIEVGDVITLLDHLGIGKVVTVGTSRGGIVSMMMAALHPERLAGVVMNDIGPVLDPVGLSRIVEYVGKPSRFSDWDDAIAAMKRTSFGFETLTEAQWDYFSRFTFTEDENGIPTTDYDLNLGKTMPAREEIEANGSADLWDLFEALKPIPAGAIRGANSDLLGDATLREMQKRHPNFEIATVPDRGHTPFLDEPESLALIEEVISKAEMAS